MLFSDYLKQLNESKDAVGEYKNEELMPSELADKVRKLLSNNYYDEKIMSPFLKIAYLKEILDVFSIALSEISDDYTINTNMFPQGFRDKALKIIDNAYKNLDSNAEKLVALKEKYSSGKKTYRLMINQRNPNYTLDDVKKFLEFFKVQDIKDDIYPESQNRYLICKMSELLASEVYDRFAGLHCKLM